MLLRRRELLLAALGGVVFALTAPPTNLYPAVLIGLALLAASIHGLDGAPPTFWVAFGRAAVWGTSAGLVGLRFVPVVIQRFTPLGVAASILALALLAAGQSLTWAIGAGVAALLRRRARAPIELAFGAGALITLSLPAIFAWSPAGLVTPWPSFVQLADVIGERGVSVIFAVAAALLARALIAAIRDRRASRAVMTPIAIAIAIIVALPIHGAIRMGMIRRASEDLPVVKVGLVNHAVPPLDRWDPQNHPAILRSLKDLTRALERDGAELVVWPEAAYPYPIEHRMRTAPRDAKRAILGGGVRGPVLFGLITLDEAARLPSGSYERNSFNSASIVTPDGALQPPYDKLELLWFGETVPGSAYFPWLRRQFQRSGGLIPGAEPRALTLDVDRDSASAGRSIDPTARPSLRMAVLNCYEDTLPSLGVRLVRSLSPNLLVNVTNDAWFYGTAEPELHARLGAVRAIEHRLDLVRAVNMGVTSWVDASGAVRGVYDRREAGTLLASPAIRAPNKTLYARAGDVPAWLALAAITIGLAIRARRPRWGDPGVPPNPPGL